MLQNMKIAFRCFFTITLLCGVVYPLVVQGLSYVGMRDLAKGSLLYNSHQEVIGSKLIGQFTREPQYFWNRPSATQPPYHVGSATASNYAVIDPAYKAVLEARMKRVHEANPDFHDALPMDALTASASGLDPHISVENANMQAARVAKARHMQIADVQKFIEEHTEPKQFGIFGQPRVNVLELNLALDASAQN